MTPLRQLIVNADDFGQSSGINEGIARAFEEGIVTSASLLVRWPAAREAAEYARNHPALSVGLHLDLGEWTCRDGAWVPLYQVVPPEDEGAVEREIVGQLEGFRSLMRRDPTHLDSHQHIHRREPVLGLMRRWARSLQIPLREFDDRVRHEGGFYGQYGAGEPYPEGIRVERLIHMIQELTPGITELGCHPATRPDMDALYREERLEEVKALCDPRLRTALTDEKIALISYHQLVKEHGP